MWDRQDLLPKVVRMQLTTNNFSCQKATVMNGRDPDHNEPQHLSTTQVDLRRTT
jgi:hypothetical protein